MARLIRVVPGQDPGFRHVRSGSGFRYVDPAGDTAPEADPALCPLPVLRLRKFLSNAAPGTRVALIATDAMAAIDVPHFCAESGHVLISVTEIDGATRYEVMRGAAFACRAPA